MKIVSGICFFILSILSVCLAAQTENVNITTYYPSPQGVYKVLRLYPTKATPDLNVPGTIYYNNTTDQVLLYSNSSGTPAWGPFGRSSSVLVQANKTVWPDTCDGTTFLIPDGSDNYELCSGLWYKNITFSPAFNTAPNVFVSAEFFGGSPSGSDPVNYTCSEHGSRMIRAYAGNITNTSFRLFLSGGYERDIAGPCESLISGAANKTKLFTYYLKGVGSWIAIGE